MGKHSLFKHPLLNHLNMTLSPNSSESMNGDICKWHKTPSVCLQHKYLCCTAEPDFLNRNCPDSVISVYILGRLTPAAGSLLNITEVPSNIKVFWDGKEDFLAIYFLKETARWHQRQLGHRIIYPAMTNSESDVLPAVSSVMESALEYAEWHSTVDRKLKGGWCYRRWMKTPMLLPKVCKDSGWPYGLVGGIRWGLSDRWELRWDFTPFVLRGQMLRPI